MNSVIVTISIVFYPTQRFTDYVASYHLCLVDYH